jgi:hypothetical protein
MRVLGLLIFNQKNVPFLELRRQQIPEIVDFPTPPLADDTAITFFTSVMRLLFGSPRCIRGIVPVRGKPFLHVNYLS